MKRLSLLFALPLGLALVTGADAQNIGPNGGGGSSGTVANTATIIAQSAIGHGSSETSQAITTPTGIAVGDCLFMCAQATQKPTSVITCPSGFTLIETGGQVSDGTYQPQTALCSRVVTGAEATTYTYTWSGSAFGNGAEIDVRGLTQCTNPDAIYTAGNTGSTGMLSGGVSGLFGPETNIYCAGSEVNFAISPAALIVGNSATAMAFGLSIGSAASSVFSAGNAFFAISGALLH